MVSIVSSSLKGLVLGKDGLSPLAVFSKCIIYFLSAPSGHLAQQPRARLPRPPALKDQWCSSRPPPLSPLLKLSVSILCPILSQGLPGDMRETTVRRNVRNLA